VFGTFLDSVLQSNFSFIGSTLILLFVFAAGFSLFTGWSWILIVEKLGGAMIGLFQLLVAKYRDKKDREAGRIAEQQRTNVSVLRIVRRFKSRCPHLRFLKASGLKKKAKRHYLKPIQTRLCRHCIY
jgi:S-DNA-T family DNA segregation ATPase FtsK/SpoIIIE